MPLLVTKGKTKAQHLLMPPDEMSVFVKEQYVWASPWNKKLGNCFAPLGRWVKGTARGHLLLTRASSHSFGFCPFGFCPQTLWHDPLISLGCCAWRHCGCSLLSGQGSALTCYALSIRSYHRFAGGEKKCPGVERQPQLSQEQEQPSGGSPPSLPQLPLSPASEHRVPAKQPRIAPLIKALLEYTLFNNSFSPRFLLSSWSCNSRKGFTVLTVVSTMRPRGLLDSSPDQGK